MFSLLRLHRPDCEQCNAREKYGLELRKRLEELGWGTQPHSPTNGDHGAIVEVFRSEPGEVVARSPIPAKRKEQKQIA
jgi:hypothetical protein